MYTSMSSLFQPFRDSSMYANLLVHLLMVTSVLPDTPPTMTNEDSKFIGKPRKTRSNCGSSSCDDSFITNHQTFYSGVVFNSYFPPCGSGSGSGPCKNGTNISPPKQTKTFTVKFDLRQLALDLYWLMDATGSFNATRYLLEKQAATYVDAINNLKSIKGDFTIGYGTFTDKHGIPTKRRKRGIQAGELSAKGRSAASGRVINYNNNREHGSHGLYNILSLQKIDADGFSKKVAMGLPNITSGRKEDILTGLHQVATCDAIGWRQDTRRILFLTTDQRYYQAGDKEFVGEKNDKFASTSVKVIPFDGACHLSGSGFFDGDEYNKYDYPSTKQVRDSLREKGITMIFAIGQTENDDWNQTETRLSISEEYRRSLAPALTDNPILVNVVASKTVPIEITEIVRIIEESFDEVKDNEILESFVTPDSMKNIVNVEATCITNPGDKTKICKVSEGDKEVSFNIKVTVPCPWIYNDVTLNVNLRGRTDPPRLIDLASICK